MQNNKSFTVKYEGLSPVLKIPCGVSEAYIPNIEIKHPPIKKYMAIWDTGATGSVITKKVAVELGLKPSGIANVSHANGISAVNTYLVNILLPNNIGVVGLPVTEAILSGDTEMLIGMDIIARGDFSVTNFEGKTCFSFRIPSIKTIDYCEEARLQQEKDSKPSFLKRKYNWKGK